MTLVLGVDPGNSGAFAVYDATEQRIVGMQDMPLWYQTVGKRKKMRIDALSLAEMFDVYADVMGVRLAVLEAVGGRTGQGAHAGFVFGYGVGLIYMGLLYSRIAVETVPPATWKKIMRVPGKGRADDTAIIQRADELFPLDRAYWRGKQGGLKSDRAEAAMLARFGADHVLNAAHLNTTKIDMSKADIGA